MTPEQEAALARANAKLGEQPDDEAAKAAARAAAIARANAKLSTPPKPAVTEAPSEYDGVFPRLFKDYKGVVTAVAEPVAKLISGAVAKPVSDVAGLVSGTADVLSGGKLGGRGAQEVQQDVQRAMTYEPVTTAGKSSLNPLNAVPELFGKTLATLGETGASFAGERLPGSMDDPTSIAGAGANFVREAIPQALGLGMAAYGPRALTSTGQSMQHGAQGVMRNALGAPQQAIASGQAGRAAQVLLDEGLGPNVKGAATLRERLGQAQSATDELVKNRLETIPVAEVLRALDEPRIKALGQVDPTANVAAIDRLADRFSLHPSIVNNQVPVAVANAMQRGTAEKLATGRSKSPLASGQEAIAEALRTGISTRIPDAAASLAREAELSNALSLTERRAFGNLTKNPVDLGLYVHSPVARAGYLANKSTAFKSYFARLLNSLGKGAETVGTGLNTVISGGE